MGRHADPDPRHFWRSVAAACVRAGLALVLVVGLFAVLAAIDVPDVEDGPVILGGPEEPADAPDATAEPSGDDADTESTADPVGDSPPADALPSPDPEPSEDPEPTAAPEPEPTEPVGEPDAAVLAAAPPPSETSVQVLDGVGDPARLERLVAALEELGYVVVAQNRASDNYPVTTVLFSAGREAAAQALQARDPRVRERHPNPGLSEQVDLHVVLGADWQSE